MQSQQGTNKRTITIYDNPLALASRLTSRVGSYVDMDMDIAWATANGGGIAGLGTNHAIACRHYHRPLPLGTMVPMLATHTAPTHERTRPCRSARCARRVDLVPRRMPHHVQPRDEVDHEAVLGMTRGA